MLAQGGREDDRAFMEALYRRYGRLMFAAARRCLNSGTEAEDAVQTALLSLLGRVEQLRTMGEAALAGYIRAAARNAALNILREQERGERRREKLSQDPPELAPTMDELLVLYERRSALRAVLERMRPEERVLLEGKYLLHRSDAELAEILGCQTDSVRMKLTRARRAALKMLREWEVTPDEKP